MQLVHDPEDGDPRPLATEVEVADSLLAQARGLMFREPVPDDYALVFQFSVTRTRGLHMLFVRFPIDAVWLVDGTVTKTARLRSWLGWGFGRGDTVVELPAGAAEDVEEGDQVYLD